MALAISGSVGRPSTIAAGCAAKLRWRRKSAVLSPLGIEFSGHATVAAVGIQLGWDAALCTRLGVQGRAGEGHATPDASAWCDREVVMAKQAANVPRGGCWARRYKAARA